MISVDDVVEYMAREIIDWCEFGGSPKDVLGRIQREYDKYVELNKNVENDK